MGLPERLDEYAEAELLAKVARQDAEAFACFYDRTSGVLFAIARKILGDATLAEDVLQEVYLQIWEKAEVFDPALGKPISWAIALTRNRALDKLRSHRRREDKIRQMRELTDDRTGQQSPVVDAEANQTAAAVAEALQKIEPNKRKAIELAFIKGLSHAEVAEAMRHPLGTVKAWIRRGMLELREELTDRL